MENNKKEISKLMKSHLDAIYNTCEVLSNNTHFVRLDSYRIIISKAKIDVTLLDKVDEVIETFCDKLNDVLDLLYQDAKAKISHTKSDYIPLSIIKEQLDECYKSFNDGLSEGVE